MSYIIYILLQVKKFHDLGPLNPTTYLWHLKREVWSEGPHFLVTSDISHFTKYNFCTTVLNGTAIMVIGGTFNINGVIKLDTVFLVNIPLNSWIRYPSLEILDYVFGGRGVVMTFDKSGHR